jgi:hypothetical protein
MNTARHFAVRRHRVRPLFRRHRPRQGFARAPGDAGTSETGQRRSGLKRHHPGATLPPPRTGFAGLRLAGGWFVFPWFEYAIDGRSTASR